MMDCVCTCRKHADQTNVALLVCVQPDINEKMRAILIDWLVEVHLKFKVCLLPSMTVADCS